VWLHEFGGRCRRVLFQRPDAIIASANISLISLAPAGLGDSSASSLSGSSVFLGLSRCDTISAKRMSEKVIWQILRPYAEAARVAGIAPHDCRRNRAKLCRAAGGELEQIHLLLGHASVHTTERYWARDRTLHHAPNDGIKLRVDV
jgi:integrase